jgi:hypothetical protein
MGDMSYGSVSFTGSMSGRLVILPKKSYCPWNRKNLERIERDEQQHQQLLLQQEQYQRQIASEQRWDQLSASRLKRTTCSPPQEQVQEHDPQEQSNEFHMNHFSLFAREEQQDRVRCRQQQELLPSTNECAAATATGAVADFVGIRHAHNNDSKTFSIGHFHHSNKKQNSSSSHPSWNIREAKRLQTMDPMASYVDNETELDHQSVSPYSVRLCNSTSFIHNEHIDKNSININSSSNPMVSPSYPSTPGWVTRSTHHMNGSSQPTTMTQHHGVIEMRSVAIDTGTMVIGHPHLRSDENGEATNSHQHRESELLNRSHYINSDVTHASPRKHKRSSKSKVKRSFTSKEKKKRKKAKK